MISLNLKNIDAKAVVKGLVSTTPILFLVVGFASFILFGLFEGTYYYAITDTVIKQWWLSTIFCVAFPTILELTQFGFMMATVWNYTNRKPIQNNKWINFDRGLIYSIVGLCGTVLVIWFKLNELSNMVEFWRAGNFSSHIQFGLQFLIIIGIVLEIRIIMIMNE